MTIEYPQVSLPAFPDINDTEVIFWINRTGELETPLLNLLQKLPNHFGTNNKALIMLQAVIRRQLEISESLLLLASKGRMRDTGVLLLNIYELTLDLQYIALDITRLNLWLLHQEEKTKPWRVANQIKEIFPNKSDYESEMKLYKHYSMIKHGNIAGKFNSFNMFVENDNLMFSIAEPFHVIPNLYAVGFLLKRTCDSSMKILNGINIHENEIEGDMRELYTKYNQNLNTLMQLKVIQAKYPEDEAKQKEVVEKLKLYFED